ncbi:MASE1 domain-containing protein [Amycolatopsis sp. 195334CR]|uniref:MASE1 domain-containing protein n=1 Tax=Amycolatopsis sp. 195334CR TaxID=2814588 RepID=UPI001A8DBA4D|nr:MASE1 domain-containing protein [Amycolatopsis sp. 195334CR]MBN6033620.1 MASE1 domain-containing protein [Amycolatopsis sp. 195334CR]
MGSRSARWAAAVLALAVCYYLGARLGLEFALVRGQVAPLWPSTGLAVAAMLRFGVRLWPGALLGSLAANAPLGPSPLAVLGIAAGAAAAPSVAVLLLRHAGFRTELTRLRDVMSLVLFGAVAGMAISATVGVGTLTAAGAIPREEALTAWSVWWAGDATGLLVFAPAALVLFTAPRVRWPEITTAHWVQAAALTTGTLALAAAVAAGQVPWLFIIFPVVIWCAWRLGLAVVAPCLVIATTGTTIAAALGAGPFAGQALVNRMVLLQSFNGALVLTGLLLAAAAAEQRVATAISEQAGAELEARVTERTAMFTEAERVGRVGSWERDVATDAVTWSDQMFRLYGLVPRSRELTYQTFLAYVHPDDRELVTTTNEQALRDHLDTEIAHRVVWPDGTIRWLNRRASLVVDKSGVVRKMVGTAQDITAARTAAAETRLLLESGTDAILGFDAAGLVTLANDRAADLFGELTGEHIKRALPELDTDRAVQGAEVVGRRQNGAEFPAEVTLRPLSEAEAAFGGTVAVAVVRDLTRRKEAERARRQLQDEHRRRQQALEINDNVIQGLSAALYALDSGESERAVRTLRRTLDTARETMRNLLHDSTGIAPGDLVRRQPAALAPPAKPAADPRPAASAPVTAVIADDSREVRFALRALLESLPGITVVGEVADGIEAVRIATERQPDAMLLDLAMPAMDGLEALPLILAASPGTKVIVVSGYGRDQVAEQALRLGATAYVEKGGSTRLLANLLADLFSEIGRERREPPPSQDTDDHSGLDPQTELAVTCAHELRNPITALTSITQLLREQSDRMPSATVHKLLGAMARSLRQIDRLVQDLADAGRMLSGNLELLLEPTDLGDLARTVLGELADLTDDHPVELRAEAGVVAGVDPFRIRQVLANLLGNAAKFSPPGSPIRLTLAVEGERVEIAVTDRGPGVPAEHRDRLFGKFERLGSTQKGTGLGLYISQEIARAH